VILNAVINLHTYKNKLAFSFIRFHVLFFLVRVAEATALRKLEKPHGYRQTVTVLLAPHQDGTKQHTPRRDQTTHTKTGPNNTHQDGTKQGRRCSHVQDLWEGGPADTLFRGPTATEGPETEGTLECLLPTNSE